MTPFKKFMESIRLKNKETLTAMAKKLGTSAAYLCQIESGKRAIPTLFPDKLSKLYQLTEPEKTKLNQSIEMSMKSITISLIGLPPEKRELAILFARVFSSLTKQQCEEIKQLIKNTQKIS